MSDIETTIRTAAEQCRRVIVRFQSPSGTQYEREMEPYVLSETELTGFEYVRNGYHTLPLADIVSLELTPRHFQPRRAIELK
jgi:hypothetical protein